MATFKNTVYSASFTAVASATMNALANAAYAYGAEIDNSTNLYSYGTLELTLSSAVTSVAPAYISVFIIENLGSGTYEFSSGNPGVSAYQSGWFGPGGSITNMKVKGIILPPNKYKVIIQNSLGVAFPSTNTSTCNMFGFNEASV